MTSEPLRWRPRWELFGTPTFLVSIVVLLVNDHLLKAAWPGLVTGKLSDVAGVVMIAVVFAAVVGRPMLACGITAVAFSGLKTVPVVAVWMAPVLGGVTRTDPTDLVALLALVPLARWMSSALEAGFMEEGLEPSAQSHRASIAGTSIAVQVLAVTAAVFATTATGCDSEGVERLSVTSDGRLIAVDPGFVSDDGGATWQAPADSLTPVAASSGPFCLPDRRCWELRSGPSFSRLLVERSADGVERTLFVAEGEAQRGLDEYEQPDCAADTFGTVVAVERGDGRHVVVAMGALGVIHVGPDDRAAWVAVGGYGIQRNDAHSEPLGLPVSTPTDTRGFGFTLPVRVVATTLVLSPLALLVAMVPLTRLARRSGRSSDGLALGLGAAGVLMGVVVGFGLLTLLFGGTSRRLTAFALIVAAIAIAIIAPLTWWYRRPMPPTPAMRLGHGGHGRPGSGALPPPDGSERRG